MNRQQRESNRANARKLQVAAHVCSNCGERGLHWVGMPVSLQNIMDNSQPDGFWTCPKLYGEDGKRLYTPPAPRKER